MDVYLSSPLLFHPFSFPFSHQRLRHLERPIDSRLDRKNKRKKPLAESIVFEKETAKGNGNRTLGSLRISCAGRSFQRRIKGYSSSGLLFTFQNS